MAFWRWKHVAVFLGLLVFFTAIGVFLAITSGTLLGAKGYCVQLIMWFPATLTAFITNTPLKVFGWKWGDWKWQLLSWITPLNTSASHMHSFGKELGAASRILIS